MTDSSQSGLRAIAHRAASRPQAKSVAEDPDPVTTPDTVAPLLYTPRIPGLILHAQWLPNSSTGSSRQLADSISSYVCPLYIQSQSHLASNAR